VLGPLLGKGGFCCVRRALHEQTGQVVACKIIEKGKLKVRLRRVCVFAAVLRQAQAVCAAPHRPRGPLLLLLPAACRARRS
jgi:serine/threonine protein kinase